MTKKLIRNALAVAVILGLAGSIPLGPSAALAQQQSGKQDKAQRSKKPGESCESLQHNTKAHADCVKAQAQDTKSARHPAGAPGKAKKVGQ